jgi:hypothetical protein
LLNKISVHQLEPTNALLLHQPNEVFAHPIAPIRLEFGLEIDGGTA